MRLLTAVAGLMILAGCGGQHAPDNTALFLRCLKESGGQQITAPTELAGYPSANVKQGIGASLESVSYHTIDAAAGKRHQRSTLVFVENPRAEPASVPLPEPAELLRRARHGEAGVHALVLMPPATNFETPIEGCTEMAAPGQRLPHP